MKTLQTHPYRKTPMHQREVFCFRIQWYTCAQKRAYGISFEEAASVFADPLSVTVPDQDHSDQEDRFIVVGTSARLRPLLISFAERSDRIRIISARKLTRSERRAYEEENRE